jgi:Flp pilus assembly protein TadG
MNFREQLKRGKARLLMTADAFRREVRGVAAVEFAFIAPIMLLLFVGTIELSAGVSVNRKLSRLSSTVSDLVTQSQTLTSTDVTNIMGAATKVMYPYTDQVGIVLTGISIDNSGTPKVVWSKAQNATPLTVGATYANVPAKIKKANTFLVAAVVTTTYTPSFGWASYNATDGLSFSRTPINMDEEIFLRPRIGSQVTVQ